MARITLSLKEADHLALKLLAIKEKKAMIGVIQEAITKHLEETGAYRLSVSVSANVSANVNDNEEH